jgi:hypothetical protein
MRNTNNYIYQWSNIFHRQSVEENIISISEFNPEQILFNEVYNLFTGLAAMYPAIFCCKLTSCNRVIVCQSFGSFYLILHFFHFYQLLVLKYKSVFAQCGRIIYHVAHFQRRLRRVSVLCFLKFSDVNWPTQC